jgi:hypothetical protein
LSLAVAAVHRTRRTVAREDFLPLLEAGLCPAVVLAVRMVWEGQSLPRTARATDLVALDGVATGSATITPLAAVVVRPTTSKAGLRVRPGAGTAGLAAVAVPETRAVAVVATLAVEAVRTGTEQAVVVDRSLRCVTQSRLQNAPAC